MTKKKKVLLLVIWADLPLEEEFEFYIQNENFRLPEEDKDIILIGPGTGIAPFRSFLQNEIQQELKVKLAFLWRTAFFFRFYYQTEIQEWISTGVLNQIEHSFSRDQQRKIYVQDRILENAKEFNQWIENGAYIYLCGQKNPMSKDVEQTLIEVISVSKKCFW